MTFCTTAIGTTQTDFIGRRFEGNARGGRRLKVDFKNIVYITHPYIGGGAPTCIHCYNNVGCATEMSKTIDDIKRKNPEWLVIDAPKMFGGNLKARFWMLYLCDEMWVYKKKDVDNCTCLSEIEFCKKNGIPYKIIKEDE